MPSKPLSPRWSRPNSAAAPSFRRLPPAESQQDIADPTDATTSFVVHLDLQPFANPPSQSGSPQQFHLSDVQVSVSCSHPATHSPTQSTEQFAAEIQSLPSELSSSGFPAPRPDDDCADDKRPLEIVINSRITRPNRRAITARQVAFVGADSLGFSERSHSKRPQRLETLATVSADSVSLKQAICSPLRTKS